MLTWAFVVLGALVVGALAWGWFEAGWLRRGRTLPAGLSLLAVLENPEPGA